ncbi:iron complex outermembrane recepter protein [Pollutimonas bauzanensis]|uniref:Iron complex outermembrane recepter protein n=2 Tax=Pollutimonas bauzanensis TaxID=658167 RepID=A0A1M5VYC9_9BURK|nr:TonB-dependent receptor [Pollutimonas bauzanensis]SHH80198.1 iron complex outermembrane recepter protein [Pollutimonas bauzanensis]
MNATLTDFSSRKPPRRAAGRLFAMTPLALALALAQPAQAQTAAAGAQAATLSPIVITGNPLGSDTLASPSTIIDGESLDLRRAGTLGETLNGLPGVSTTTYGPMVGRPVIRGMDGDRIRLLQNGVGTLDASSLSYDHAVPQDPLSTSRIEILRGPAALMYGGNAIGGVVNTIDNRIPVDPIDGVHGDVMGNYGGANKDRDGAVQLEAGNGKFALHADVFGRKTSELRIPGYARSTQQRSVDAPDDEQPRRRLPNSDGRTDGGAVGMSWTGDSGYAGLSYSGYDSDYGSVAEDSVRIKMRQERFGLAGEIRDLEGPFKSIKGNFAYTDYEHKEIDDGETGTIFKNRGYEARLEARHADIGPLQGALGLQFGSTKFSALGSEAVVPTTTTDSAALFALEEWAVNDRFKLSTGARVEYSRLSPSAGGTERFIGSEKRDFTAGSFSLGGVYKLTSIWSVAANAAYTERAPTFYELYANGPHEATGQYLVGNSGLKKERAYSSDLALRFKDGPHQGSVGVFYSHFSNYLAETNTGRFRNDDGDLVDADTDDALPEAVYTAVPADFFGIEAEGRFRVLERGGHTVDLNLSGDYTRARNSDTGEPLPRIPPLRLNAGLDYNHGPWGAGVSVTRAFAQHRKPDNDTTTTAYYSLDADAVYRFKMSGTQWQAYLRGINLTNQTIRYATSILRDVAPQGGRSVMVGLRGHF